MTKIRKTAPSRKPVDDFSAYFPHANTESADRLTDFYAAPGDALVNYIEGNRLLGTPRKAKAGARTPRKVKAGARTPRKAKVGVAAQAPRSRTPR